MFPDMYLQYNHPTIKSQQKPFDKNRQNLIPLHPPQRRCPHPPGTPQGNSAPATIQRSADSPHPPSTPQGNSAPAAIQRSADGPPPPVRPLNPHTSKKIPHSKHPPQQKILPSILQTSLTKDTVYTSNINYPPKHHTDLSLPQPTHRTDCRRGGCMVGTRCVGVSRWSY